MTDQRKNATKRTAEDVYWSFVESAGEEACALAVLNYLDQSAIVEILLERINADELEQFLNDNCSNLTMPTGGPKPASGYDFEPLPEGRFLLEFYGMDGYTFAQAIMERSQIESISEVVKVVLKYADEHGAAKRESSVKPEGYLEWLAKRRRQEMGLE